MGEFSSNSWRNRLDKAIKVAKSDFHTALHNAFFHYRGQKNWTNRGWALLFSSITFLVLFPTFLYKDMKMGCFSQSENGGEAE